MRVGTKMSEDAELSTPVETISDLKKRQEEFRKEKILFYHLTGPEGFDTFRLSPEYQAMKETLEFYADREHWNISDPNGSAHVIHSSDVDDETNFGGNKARSVLSQLTESEGEK